MTATDATTATKATKATTATAAATAATATAATAATDATAATTATAAATATRATAAAGWARLRLLGAGALIVLAGLALAPARPAEAQVRCGQREAIVRHLATRYGETRRSVGLQEGRGIVEVYVNADSGSWTILLTTPEGLSCLMAAGEAYQAIEAAARETPA